MNFILYVHDTKDPMVWDPERLGVQGAVDAVQREIGELVESYTMGQVTVDAVPDGIPVNTHPRGHRFVVMCPFCLGEPFDLGDDVYGECFEREDDDE